MTDEFLDFVRVHEADLSQMSQFVVIAATLLDMKAARLLPHEEVEEEDVEILSARDLLFAKLLQYKAYKDVAADLAATLAVQSLSHARDVPMEERFRALLPEVELRIGVEDLALLAARALTRMPEEVTFNHLHDPLVPVETQVDYLRQTLVVGERVSFTELCRQAHSVTTVVSRFLAVLEMLRGGEVDVEQNGPLATLFITRTATPKDARPSADVSAALLASAPSAGKNDESEDSDE